jgi:chromosome segregation ATPase
VTVVVYIFYEIKKHRGLNGSLGVLNNNAIAIAKDSAKAIEDNGEVIKNVLAEAASIAELVTGYKEELAALLGEIRKNAEEKQSLEDMLHSVQKTLETSKMASKELADEVAELLVLANIPPSKKEELYARHRAAVDAITAVENTEVVNDDGKET